MAYDALNRVQSVALAPSGATPQTLASYQYTFYPTGNRHTVSELSGRVVIWSYDNLWRLTNETIAGSPTAGSISYVYDNTGNRQSRTSTVLGISNQAEVSRSRCYPRRSRELASCGRSGPDLNVSFNSRSSRAGEAGVRAQVSSSRVQLGHRRVAPHAYAVEWISLPARGVTAGSRSYAALLET